MYKWVIFDMDWLLIDSEPLWEKAERKALKKVWINLTNAMAWETTWLKIIEVSKYWYAKFPWDLNGFSHKNICDEIMKEIIRLVIENPQKKKWVEYIFEYFKNKGYKIAINSASDYSLINTVIDKFELSDFLDAVHSWEDEVYWKPHPSGYINTCKKLWLEPTECIAFEDSLNGVLSVKSWRIKCIAIPEAHNISNPKFQIADVILSSLDEFDDKILCGL